MQSHLWTDTATERAHNLNTLIVPKSCRERTLQQSATPDHRASARSRAIHGTSVLSGQPQIELIARDRGGGYGLASAKALPEATQVADRWHLMENASRVSLMPSANPCVRYAQPSARQPSLRRRRRPPGFGRSATSSRSSRFSLSPRPPPARRAWLRAEAACRAARRPHRPPVSANAAWTGSSLERVRSGFVEPGAMTVSAADTLLLTTIWLILLPRPSIGCQSNRNES